jgi:hypothetical protein
MLVEEVGRGVRIVVWRSNGVIWSEQVLASASAANARTGMIIAERMALLHGEVTTAAIWPPWGSFFLSNPNGGRLDL